MTICKKCETNKSDRKIVDSAIYQETVKLAEKYKGQRDELLEVADEARLQIEYLHDEFRETGSGNCVLAKLRSVVNKVEQSL